MRKLAVVVALIGAVVLAAVAGALEVNSLRPVTVIPTATVDSVEFVVAADDPRGLPTGITAFTGTGDEFYVRFWEFVGDSVWAYGSVFGVPGSFTLPRPSAERRGDSLYVKAEFYCGTDSVTVIGTDR